MLGMKWMPVNHPKDRIDMFPLEHVFLESGILEGPAAINRV